MIRSWLAKHVFYPTQDGLRGLGSLRRWRELEQSQCGARINSARFKVRNCVI